MRSLNCPNEFASVRNLKFKVVFVLILVLVARDFLFQRKRRRRLPFESFESKLTSCEKQIGFQIKKFQKCECHWMKPKYYLVNGQISHTNKSLVMTHSQMNSECIIAWWSIEKRESEQLESNC